VKSITRTFSNICLKKGMMEPYAWSTVNPYRARRETPGLSTRIGRWILSEKGRPEDSLILTESRYQE
jgi:hypothetical protein